MKSNKIRKMLIQELKKMPIIEVACKRVGIGRATFYRWKKEDKKFAKDIDNAILEGAFLINDMAESQLISAIREKNMAAIRFWLKHRHPAYSDKIQVSKLPKPEKKELTSEEMALIERAIKLDYGDDYFEKRGEKQQVLAGNEDES